MPAVHRNEVALQRLIESIDSASLRLLARKAGIPLIGSDEDLRANVAASQLTISKAISFLSTDALRLACGRLGIASHSQRSDIIAALLGTHGPADRTVMPIRPRKSLRERLLDSAHRESLQSMLGQSSVGRMVDDELWKLRGLLSNLSDLSEAQITTHMTDNELRALSPDPCVQDRAQVLNLLGIEPERVDAATNLMAIDVETADEGADSVCCVGFVVVADAVIKRRGLRVIRPPRPVRDIQARIHGLTEELFDRASDFRSVWHDIAPLMKASRILIAHNASFERRVLGAACECIGMTLDAPWVCTLQLARRCWRLESYSLEVVCRCLGINVTHHNALSDAEAALRIFAAAQRSGVSP